MNENERIARAAGLDFWKAQSLWKSGNIVQAGSPTSLGTPIQFAVEYIGPDWRNDPGAVTTWLLPVLEKRWPNVCFARAEFKNNPGVLVWSASEDLTDAQFGRGLSAPTWHEAVIEAILEIAWLGGVQ